MIYRLTGQVQHYAWGGKNYIASLIGLHSAKDQPCAEWWLGAHPSAPSEIEDVTGKQSLIEFLLQNPTALGQASRQQFGDELPYLLKILDVEKPLSIQLHPTKSQAEKGFEAENAKGVALTDSTRTYKDRNHKPEMMIALSDFWLLHGFKTKAQILTTLNARPSLQPLAEKLGTQSLAEFYADVMLADQSTLANWLLPIIEANQQPYRNGELALDNPDYWVLYTMEAMAISPEKLEKGKQKVRKYGSWAGLLAWIPILGSVITVAMGYLRTNLLYSVFNIAVGKFVRYAILISAYKAL